MGVLMIPIYRMVLNRLSFLVDNEANQQLVSDFIYEVAYELETCFRVRFYTDDDGNIQEDWTRVGEDDSYNIGQKSVIADLVASYILMMATVQNSQGNGDPTTPPVTTFLKRAKAGSAEVEWGQFSVKDGNMLYLNADSLLNRYQAQAERKARNFGCILDICNDCVAKANDFQSATPFLVVSDCGCGC